MPAPALGSFAQRLYDRISPLAYADAQNGYALAYFCQAIGKAFQVIEDLAGDGPAGQLGWSVILDINRIADAGLPYLAQFVGVQLNPSLTPTQQRYRIQHTDGWSRGTPAALMAVLNPLLTGGKTVIFRERDTDPYFLTVITRTAETPDSAAVLAALKTQKPAGILLTYLTSTGFTYLELRATQATYTTTRTNFATYTALRGY